MGTLYPRMLTQTKLVRDGNSWAVRLPKILLKLSGLPAGGPVQLAVRPGRIVIYKNGAAVSDRYSAAKSDARQVWQEAFEQVWLEIFGVDE